MRTILALAATSLLALSAPAFAQDAGAPGAVGVTGSLTGSNPGSGYGSNGPIGDSINPGPGPGWNNGYGYNNGPGPNGWSNGYGYNNGGYLNEGRAAAQDYYGPNYGPNGGNFEPTGPDSPPVYVPQRPGPYYNDGQ